MRYQDGAKEKYPARIYGIDENGLDPFNIGGPEKRVARRVEMPEPAPVTLAAAELKDLELLRVQGQAAARCILQPEGLVAGRSMLWR